MFSVAINKNRQSSDQSETNNMIGLESLASHTEIYIYHRAASVGARVGNKYLFNINILTRLLYNSTEFFKDVFS